MISTSGWGAGRARNGVAMAIGLIAVAAAAYVYGIVLPERQEALAQAHAQLAQVAAQQVRMPGETTVLPPALPHFPAASTLPDWLERIERAATQSGVALSRTEYASAPEPALGLVRHQIALPVKGSYAQVRAFAAALLESVPALALDRLELKRDSITANEVQAKLDVSVYLQESPR